MYITISGTFMIIAREGLGPYQPDGDTIRFEADNPTLFERLTRRGQGVKSPASVRFEAIDALEKDQAQGQSPNHAAAARDAMFEFLGLAQISRRVEDFVVHQAELSHTRGHLLAHSLDKYGRVIAFLFRGDSHRPDGSLVDTCAADISNSLNLDLVRRGLVYPTFYSTLSATLRGTIAGESRQARRQKRGLWALAEATPDAPTRVTSLAELQSKTIFPTLHRRLDDYLIDHQQLADFPAWLRMDPEKRNKGVLRLADASVGDLAAIVAIEGDTLRITEHPEDFVFLDDLATEIPWQHECDSHDKAAPGDVRIVAALVDVEGLDADNEVVTLLNTTSRPIDVSGWQLQDNAGSETLQAVIEPGAVFQYKTRLRLANSGDLLHLKSGDVLVDTVAYTADQVEAGRTIVFAA